MFQQKDFVPPLVYDRNKILAETEKSYKYLPNRKPK